MINRIIIAGIFSVANAAHAQDTLDPAGLLPAAVARPLLEQDPSVAAARGGLEVARQEAGILNSSPYEWTTRFTGQRRTVDNGPQSREWNATLERTLRLPTKASADRYAGKAAIAESKAQYGEALNKSARNLMAMWIDWLAAERAYELATNNLSALEEGLAAVEKRSRAGDASTLDLSVARAELAEHRRLQNDAKTEVTGAWARLSARFPGVEPLKIALPPPSPISRPSSFWRDRILAESDQLKLAQAQLQKAQAAADRARADKIPDPTAGVFTGSEQGGRERIVGFIVSIPLPLPGGARNLRSAKARAEVEVSRQEVELKKRELTAEIDSALIAAVGAYDSLQIANDGAAAAQQNANLTQRAYALGEADLQTLLLSRRQATAALNNALAAQRAALKGYYELLIDAHLVWELEHNEDSSGGE